MYKSCVYIYICILWVPLGTNFTVWGSLLLTSPAFEASLQLETWGWSSNSNCNTLLQLWNRTDAQDLDFTFKVCSLHWFVHSVDQHPRAINFSTNIIRQGLPHLQPSSSHQDRWSDSWHENQINWICAHTIGWLIETFLNLQIGLPMCQRLLFSK